MRRSLSAGWRTLIALSAALPLVTFAQTAPIIGQAASGITVPSQVHPGGLSAAQVVQLAQNATQRVIIVLRDQHAGLLVRGAQRAQRLAAVASDQTSILSELSQVSAPRVQPFHVVNAIAATVSAAEAARLAANPLVSAVVPDRFIPAPRPVQGGAAASNSAAASAPFTGTTPCTTTTPAVAPEALQLTGTTAAQQVVTGTGVTVAFIADGLDINNPEFIRPDGSHVFVDYKDFSGDGPNSPTAGGEAFGDASSIAAQGNLTYDLNQFVHATHRIPTSALACPIKVLGMAPGASLMGLNVFGSLGGAYNSTTIQAVEYAVDHGADVINESLGLNISPDNATDPLSLANDAAVAAGVVVTVSTGDAGTANTIGAPSTDPNIISVGSTTQFREYVETVRYGAQLGSLVGGHNDWVSNNISAFSSSGVAENGRQTVDLVMPGDSSYEACTPDTSRYADCTNFNNDPSNLGFFAGTSESAPLAAGEAALVIQAYRQAHGGASPSPAVVKQILLSTASDLGIPSYEQGAGLGNSAKAVQAAQAYGATGAQTGGASVTPVVLSSPSVLTAEGAPGSSQAFQLRLSNGSAITETVVPYVRTLAAPFYQASFTPALDPTTAPSFIDHVGQVEYYAQQDFTVPAGAQRLDAAISWGDLANQPHALVRLVLFDPQGRFTAFTYPDNPSPYPTQRYGHVDVRFPTAGTWHAFVTTRVGSTVYSGPVHLSITASRFTLAGTVSASSCTLSPGASCTVTVTTRIPQLAGDQTEEVAFAGVDAHGTPVSSGAVPIVLRSLVPTGPTGGLFTGVLTGGNGRGSSPAQVLTYDFDVPTGLHDFGISLGITDTNYNLVGVLADPTGTPLNVQTTVVSTGGPPSFIPQTYTNRLQFFRRDPQAGRWRLILLLNLTASGNQTALPFLGVIRFNSVSVQAAGLPNSPLIKLSSVKPQLAQVTIANTGVTTESYFIDPRLTTYAPLSLGSGSTGLRGGVPFWVPTESHSLFVVAQSSGPTIPINLEISNGNGITPFGFTSSPDIAGTPIGNGAAVATSSAPEVAPGQWFGNPVGLGPFSAPAPNTTVLVSAAVLAQQFDTAVSSGSGDAIANASGVSSAPYAPLVLGPGQSGTINVTITPNAPSGTVVSGNLYVDTLAIDPNSGVFLTGAGDEAAAIPYSYTVK